MEVNVLIEHDFEGCPGADWLRDIAGQVLITEGVDDRAELGLVITGQEEVQELNRHYRGKDEPTDVLSFFMTEGTDEPESDVVAFVAPPDGVLHLGEVIISYPQAVIQAQEQGHSAKKELALLIVHGVLHLLGYDHIQPAEAQRMRDKEKEIREQLERNPG